jgi:hypothetical protein
MRGLLCHEILERRDEVEARLRARHRHVEQAPLLLDLLGAAGGELDGKLPSATLSTYTASHSWPLAECTVERMR